MSDVAPSVSELNASIRAIPFAELLPGASVRVTPDGLIWAVDLVVAVTGKNRNDANEIFRDLKEDVFSTEKIRLKSLPGKGNGRTKLVTFDHALELIMVLPGKLAKELRVKACEILRHYFAGDTSLAAEIAANAASDAPLQQMARAASRAEAAAAPPLGFDMAAVTGAVASALTPAVVQFGQASARIEGMSAQLGQVAARLGAVDALEEANAEARHDVATIVLQQAQIVDMVHDVSTQQADEVRRWERISFSARGALGGQERKRNGELRRQVGMLRASGEYMRAHNTALQRELEALRPAAEQLRADDTARQLELAALKATHAGLEREVAVLRPAAEQLREANLALQLELAAVKAAHAAQQAAAAAQQLELAALKAAHAALERENAKLRANEGTRLQAAAALRAALALRGAPEDGNDGMGGNAVTHLTRRFSTDM